jgi:hypothetical protein
MEARIELDPREFKAAKSLAVEAADTAISDRDDTGDKVFVNRQRPGDVKRSEE